MPLFNKSLRRGGKKIPSGRAVLLSPGSRRPPGDGAASDGTEMPLVRAINVNVSDIGAKKNQDMNPFGYLGDGVTFVFLGLYFGWLGIRQKSQKKILGMSYRLFASLVGGFMVIYGIVDLVDGGWL